MAEEAKPKRKNDLEEVAAEARGRANLPFRNTNAYNAPWWFFILILAGIAIAILISTDEDYNLIFEQLKEGIFLTLYLATVSYLIALIIGLLTGIVRANQPQKPPANSKAGRVFRHAMQTVLYNLVTLYIEFMRGIPTLVFLLISGFIIVPALRDSINDSILPILRDVLQNQDIPDLVWRGRDAGTAIAGLSLVYGAFLSEVFRAGIQSIEKGQREAARSLGMTYFQTMRYIVIPQAIRNILPPLGNDFVAMIKDTSLVTILGTNEITQIARKWSGSTFLYVPTYAVLSVIYLTMTILGSIIVQFMENYLNQHRQP